MTPQEHAQVKELFLAAAALPPEHRNDFLNHQCPNQDGVRREVERLLAHHDAQPSQPGDPSAAQPQSTTADESDPSSAAESDASIADEDVFHPGHIIDGRYRIVALLGRGGMGNVYRADDLRLGQTIAIKFLAGEGLSNPAWKRRFHQEVRLAREVTHPNVCRVYDIGEADGALFITMEYVDGENLKSLLERIGRLPGDKALEIARQLCAGLSAAHVRGVLHRDLKPANVMIDGKGRVRITDFGLAVLEDEAHRKDIRAGTPRYMAPEQAAGMQVSERSDIYSLGLILYEMFTGKPAFTADDFLGYLDLHQHSDPSWPSSIVADVDPYVERTIMACLQKDPQARPESALAVFAALPGGEVLATALNVGETPSPDLVATARTKQPFGRWRAIITLSAFFGVLTLVLALVTKSHPVRSTGLDNSPPVLAARAREILRFLGYTQTPKDHAQGVRVAHGDIPAALGAGLLPDPRSRLATPAIDTVLYWYRQSPEDLVPREARNLLFQNGQVTLGDPPNFQPGMATVMFDADGHLVWFSAIPLSNVDGKADRVSPQWVQWLCSQAALDLNSLEPVPPNSDQQPLFADHRMAWTVRADDHQGIPLRIDAATAAERPVFFSVTTTYDATDEMAPAFRSQLFQVSRMLVFALLAVAALPLARRNLRLGHADRRGATRVAAFVAGLRAIEWVLLAAHVQSPLVEFQLALYGLLGAMGEAALVWLFYVALEPAVRRFWPQTMIAWSRLLTGRWRDPLVASHTLVGGLVGAILALMFRLDDLLPGWFGMVGRGQLTREDRISHLLSVRQGLAKCVDDLQDAIYTGVFFLLLITLARVVFRRTWPAVILAAIVITGVIVPLGSHVMLSWLTIGVGCVAVAITALMRYGLLTLITAIFTAYILLQFPIAPDPKMWYADTSLMAISTVVAIALLAFVITRSNRRDASPFSPRLPAR